MTWLRVDDGLTAHPKIVELSDREFRTWMRVLCWCARYHTTGVLPLRARSEILGLTNATLSKFRVLSLLDSHENALGIVHDWEQYNGTVDERVEHYLTDHPDSTANQVYRAIGGKRTLVLAAVSRFQAGSPNGSQPVPKVVPGTGSQSGSTRVLPGRAEEPATTTNALSSAESVEEQDLGRGKSEEPARIERPALPGNLDSVELGHAFRLVAAIREEHRDEHTAQIVTAYAGRLPAAAFETVREKLLEGRRRIKNDAKYAVGELKRMVKEKDG